MSVTVRKAGLSLILLVIAVILFIAAAIGVDVRVNLFDLAWAAVIAALIV